MTQAAAILFNPAPHDAYPWELPDIGEPPIDLEPRRPLPTAAEVEAIEQAAREAGFAAGYQEGRALGLKEAETEMRARYEKKIRAETEALRATHERTLRETVTALEGMAAALVDPLATSVDALEPELLELVTTLARRVIRHELVTDPRLVGTVLHHALEQLPSRQLPVRIRCHPEDQAILADTARHAGAVAEWIADPDCARGGCFIDSGPSRLDATLDTRIGQIVKALWGELTRTGGAEEPEPEPEVVAPPPAHAEADAPEPKPVPKPEVVAPPPALAREPAPPPTAAAPAPPAPDPTPDQASAPIPPIAATAGTAARS